MKPFEYQPIEISKFTLKTLVTQNLRRLAGPVPDHCGKLENEYWCGSRGSLARAAAMQSTAAGNVVLKNCGKMQASLRGIDDSFVP